MKKIMICGDKHAPFTHKGALEFFFKYLIIFKPDIVVQIGDLYDWYSMSRFPKNTSLITPAQEVYEAHKMVVEFWSRVRTLLPKARCVQILGNHDLTRIVRKAREHAPELETILLRGAKELYKFKGVETHFDPREEIVIEGIVFTHGHTKHGQHMERYKRRTVVGHTHTGGVVFKRMYYPGAEQDTQIVWELNVGYIADPNHEALKYTKDKCFTWTLGFGFINSMGVPMFIPYEE